MALVIDFPLSSRKLKNARLHSKLSLTQAVLALEEALDMEVTPGTLEGWESNRTPGVCYDEAGNAYSAFAERAKNYRHAGKNMLFGAIPLSSARDILDLTIEQIASKFGYKNSTWTRFEANARVIPEEIVVEIQNSIRIRMADLCDGGPEYASRL